jgi:transcriptional regulator with XRE-family HTH domain
MSRMKTLAQRLEEAMKDAKVSQAELARAVGRSRAAISMWLSGSTKSLQGLNLVKAARKLGVDEMWLAEGKGHKSPRRVEQESARYVIDPDLERVAAAWSLLTGEQRATYLSQIEATAHTNRLVLREIGRMPNHVTDEKVIKHYYPKSKERK